MQTMTALKTLLPLPRLPAWARVGYSVRSSAGPRGMHRYCSHFVEWDPEAAKVRVTLGPEQG